MKKLFLFKLGLVAGIFLMSILFYSSVPNTVPIHWGSNGFPDAYGSKFINLFLFPIIIFVLVLAFPFLSKLDPKKENYEKFRKTWEIFQLTIIGFFAYIQGVIIYLSFHPEVSITKFMMFGLGILFLILGNYMGKIRQNYFVGIRLPWTLSNEETWNKTHRLGGKMFFIGGIILFINGFLTFYPITIFLIILFLILVVPILYSYTKFKNISKNSG